jgi:glyceraldehyde 3-phosphate dehydrogenase
MERFGWDLHDLEQKNLIQIIDGSIAKIGIPSEEIYSLPVTGFDLDKLLLEIMRVAKRINAKRVVIDSIPALGFNYESENDIRKAILKLSYMLTRAGVTSLMTSEIDEQHVYVEGKKYPVFAEKDPAALPWKKLKVDVVIESTGRFTDSEKASAHITAGAKKVIISAPAKDEGVTPTIVLGVNSETYSGQKIISNASCTTNCITPVIAVMHSMFGIEKLMMTTIHSYTAEQNLVDGPPPGGHSNDLRRARAAALNIVPTTTGAAISATQAIPELKGMLHGLSMRVPTPVGSLSDFAVLLKKNVTVEELNQAFIDASKQERLILLLANTTKPIRHIHQSRSTANHSSNMQEKGTR